MKKKVIKITSIALITVLSLLIFVTGSINVYRVATKNDDTFVYLAKSANKVILFIGDGMGENHILNTELYLEKTLFISTIEKQGYVNTYSKNTYWPTDSAAAATAMATGKKVYNTHVGSSFGKSHTSIAEIAKENNLGVGIVTTDTLSGATPAAFSAHVKKRSYTDEIIKSQLKNNIDLYLGAGYQTYVNYQKDFENKGYTFISKNTQLTKTSNKLIGSFEKVNNYNVEDNCPTLSILTAYAINYFETNYPSGYFLMIESAHIDKSNHSNEIMNMISYLDEFDNSIQLAHQMLYDNEDICFIVTADHESGNLQLANKKDEIKNELYLSTNHTSKKVRYYINQKNNSNIKKIDDIIDNTDIFEITRKLLNI